MYYFPYKHSYKTFENCFAYLKELQKLLRQRFWFGSPWWDENSWSKYDLGIYIEIIFFQEYLINDYSYIGNDTIFCY